MSTGRSHDGVRARGAEGTLDGRTADGPVGEIVVREGHGAGESGGISRRLRLGASGHEHADVNGQGRRRKKGHEPHGDKDQRHATLVAMQPIEHRIHGAPLFHGYVSPVLPPMR